MTEISIPQVYEPCHVLEVGCDLFFRDRNRSLTSSQICSSKSLGGRSPYEFQRAQLSERPIGMP